MVSMTGGRMRERDELEGMLHDAAGRLSPVHVAALVAHPEAVCSALAAGHPGHRTEPVRPSRISRAIRARAA